MHTVRFTIQQNRLLFAPVPQGRHAIESKSQGILAMTQLPATQFADAARAEGDYRRILVDRYRNRPVAVPLASREDYAFMLDFLETRISSVGEDAPPARPTAAPAQMSML